MNLARRRLWSVPLTLIALGPAALGAHEVIVEQIVAMTLTPQNGTLVVGLHVPATAAGDPSLVGLLKGGDSGALVEQMQIVSADIARNLDVQQGGAALTNPATTSIAARTISSIDVTLRYAVQGDDGDFSARLNGFRSRTDRSARSHATGRFQDANNSSPSRAPLRESRSIRRSQRLCRRLACAA